MDQICLVLPIAAGKTQAAREFHHELGSARRSAYDASERRIGITKEVWHVARIPGGDALVAYMESADFAKALTLFVQSSDEFDLWFKSRLLEVTGLDLNDPPELTLPELVSSYQAG
jgi:hypothetical protein